MEQILWGNCYGCRFNKVFGRRCLLGLTKSETSTPYESRHEKGASIKNADKVTKHSRVSALFIFARWDAEVARGRNEPEKTVREKAANFQMAQKFDK